MYEATTAGIRVRVRPSYVDDQSQPDENYYFWAYDVEITNLGAETVQLQTRYWRITDANGRTEEVRGPGVVGEQPRLEPGQSFNYTSGCPLRTPQGVMVGSYQMVNQDGRMFDVAIPAFSLDSPHLRPTFN
ncbi:MAG: Co2+/Mg2+ efflux protein ApaG [Hyphomicrobiaceae bacterium]